MQFRILNYEKQHKKEGIFKALGRSVVFSAFYAGFLSLSQISEEILKKLWRNLTNEYSLKIFLLL